MGDVFGRIVADGQLVAQGTVRELPWRGGRIGRPELSPEPSEPRQLDEDDRSDRLRGSIWIQIPKLDVFKRAHVRVARDCEEDQVLDPVVILADEPGLHVSAVGRDVQLRRQHRGHFVIANLPRPEVRRSSRAEGRWPQASRPEPRAD